MHSFADSFTLIKLVNKLFVVELNSGIAHILWAAVSTAPSDYRKFQNDAHIFMI